MIPFFNNVNSRVSKSVEAQVITILNFSVQALATDLSKLALEVKSKVNTPPDKLQVTVCEESSTFCNLNTKDENEWMKYLENFENKSFGIYVRDKKVKEMIEWINE